MNALVFSSAYAGLSALALGMDRYQAQVWRQRPSALTKVLLQLQGTIGLIVSIGVCIAKLDWSLGLVSWLGVGMLSSLALALALTYLPRRLVVSAGLAWLLAGAAAVAGW